MKKAEQQKLGNPAVLFSLCVTEKQFALDPIMTAHCIGFSESLQ